MFDNLRDDASSSFYEEDDSDLFLEESVNAAPLVSPPRKKSGKFMGMTDIQRFIIAIMLLIAVCMLGTMCLLITGKIGLV